MVECSDTLELQIAICDDEPVMLDRLRSLTQTALSGTYHPVIHTFQSPSQLLSMQQVFQIVVLDIQLDQSNGIELARSVLKRNPDCRILFVSGFVRYVSDVYDVPHLCLILKDQLEDQLPRFLQRAASAAAALSEKSLTLLSAERLPLQEIVFLERREHWTYITLLDGTQYRDRRKLDELLAQINCQHFCRCHISYVINLQNVASIEGRQIHTVSSALIPISRPNVQKVRDTFFRYLGDST